VTVPVDEPAVLGALSVALPDDTVLHAADDTSAALAVVTTVVSHVEPVTAELLAAELSATVVRSPNDVVASIDSVSSVELSSAADDVMLADVALPDVRLARVDAMAVGLRMAADEPAVVMVTALTVDLGRTSLTKLDDMARGTSAAVVTTVVSHGELCTVELSAAELSGTVVSSAHDDVAGVDSVSRSELSSADDERSSDVV
jgi:hypothetical protein